jgi:hypothetical protein
MGWAEAVWAKWKEYDLKKTYTERFWRGAATGGGQPEGQGDSRVVATQAVALVCNIGPWTVEPPQLDSLYRDSVPGGQGERGKRQIMTKRLIKSQTLASVVWCDPVEWVTLSALCTRHCRRSISSIFVVSDSWDISYEISWEMYALKVSQGFSRVHFLGRQVRSVQFEQRLCCLNRDTCWVKFDYFHQNKKTKTERTARKFHAKTERTSVHKSRGMRPSWPKT